MVIVFLWLTLICVGMSKMADFENTPGPFRDPPPIWPRETALRLASQRYTMAVFVHPQCPCTLATLEELQKLIAREGSRLQITVALVLPPNHATDWLNARVARDAAQVMGVNIYNDLRGVEARRFGALTSGYTVIYSPAGTLRFYGGLIGARGEAGDNAGMAAIDDLLENDRSGSSHTPVFGCGLHDPPRSGDRPAKPE